MADPCGVIGVIGVAARVIQLTVQWGLDWKDAPFDARAFIGELQALKTVLSETNTNIILNQDFAGAFRGRCSTLLSQLGPTAQGTDTQLMVSACHTELQTLLNGLEERAQGHRIGWERLRGAFLSNKTQEAVRNLHRRCQTLNQLLAIDSAALIASIHQEVKEGQKQQQQIHRAQHRALDHIRDRIDNREADEERETVLNWLTPIDYAPQQHDFISRRQERTGNWLLGSAEYKAWVSAKKQTLFCPGIPGGGKTISASIVIDELTKWAGNDENAGIAYIYCNFRQKDTQKASDLLASWLKQLAQGQRFSRLKSLYYHHRKNKTRPSLDETSKTLRSVASLYSRVFIIVDALDECQTADGCRSRLLEEMFSLRDNCSVNIFATSRLLPEIKQQFNGSLTLEIRASSEDIRIYVDSQMSHLPSFVATNPDLQNEIKTEIVKAVDGM